MGLLPGCICLFTAGPPWFTEMDRKLGKLASVCVCGGGGGGGRVYKRKFEVFEMVKHCRETVMYRSNRSCNIPPGNPPGI